MPWFLILLPRIDSSKLCQIRCSYLFALQTFGEYLHRVLSIVWILRRNRDVFIYLLLVIFTNRYISGDSSNDGGGGSVAVIVLPIVGGIIAIIGILFLARYVWRRWRKSKKYVFLSQQEIELIVLFIEPNYCLNSTGSWCRPGYRSQCIIIHNGKHSPKSLVASNVMWCDVMWCNVM